MTDLDEILAFLVDNVDGALVAAVGGVDGLLVDKYPDEGRSLTGATAELTNVLLSARSIFSDYLEAGPLSELILTSDSTIVYLRSLNDAFFCLILMNASGNIGKARLYSEEASRKVLEVFA